MKRRRIGIYIMVEGLGFQFLRSHDFLPDFEYRAGLRTPLGDPIACRATALTGCPPRTHGLTSSYPRRNGSSAFDAARRYSWLPSFIANRSVFRRRIANSTGQPEDGIVGACPVGLLPEFDQVDHERLFRAGGLHPCRTIFDQLAEDRLSHRTWPGWESEEGAFEAAESELARGDVDFLFLRISSIGELLRSRGSGSDSVRARMMWAGSWIERLRDQAETVADVSEFFVFSDQGACDVHGAVDLLSAVETDFGRNGRRYLAFYEPTMARFWIDDEIIREDFHQFLTERSEGRCITAEERDLLGWDGKDRRQGDAVFLVNEGLQILPNYRGRRASAALSGYHPDAVSSEAAILGLWSPSDELKGIGDLHRLMTRTVERLAQE